MCQTFDELRNKRQKDTVISVKTKEMDECCMIQSTSRGKFLLWLQQLPIAPFTVNSQYTVMLRVAV